MGLAAKRYRGLLWAVLKHNEAVSQVLRDLSCFHGRQITWEEAVKLAETGPTEPPIVSNSQERHEDIPRFVHNPTPEWIGGNAGCG